MILTVGLQSKAFIMLTEVSYIWDKGLHFAENLYHKWKLKVFKSFLCIYWFSQKVNLRFSITSYRKNWINFLPAQYLDDYVIFIFDFANVVYPGGISYLLT